MYIQYTYILIYILSVSYRPPQTPLQIPSRSALQLRNESWRSRTEFFEGLVRMTGLNDLFECSVRMTSSIQSVQ